MTHQLTVFGLPDDSPDVVPPQISPSQSELNATNRCEPTHEELRAENQRLRMQMVTLAFREFLGQAPNMVHLRNEISAVDDDMPVLIRGEAGSGVETAAQALHACGKRAHRPFVKIDCNLLTAERLAQELSFTETPTTTTSNFEHQNESIPTRLQQARGGTLFIKHVDAVPLPLQKKLVALVRQQRLEAAEPSRARSIDVRIIAATHADLNQLVENRRFREDLREKLAERTIEIPALRNRLSDIALLVEHFIARIAVAEGKPAKRLTIDALKQLHGHAWPGNVAELKNVVERACFTSPGELLTAEVIRPWIGNLLETGSEQQPGLSLREMERKLIETTFARCEGNRERTAKALQIGLRTLSGKLREYGYPPRGGPRSKLQPARLRAA